MRPKRHAFITLWSLLMIFTFSYVQGENALPRILDRDGNGKLSWEELFRPATEIFKLYDKNGNGYLEKEEFDAIPHAASDFSLLDGDNNGLISVEELKEAAKIRFSACDKNNDGFLQPHELKACSPANRTLKVKRLDKSYPLTLYSEDYIPVFHIFF